jgi:MFS transporter, OFA family, oxalate/formate antiporter
MLVWGGLASILQPPPNDYVPVKSASLKQTLVHDKDNLRPGEMLRTPQFYQIWFMYACGAGAGLMVISKLAPLPTSRRASSWALFLSRCWRSATERGESSQEC